MHLLVHYPPKVALSRLVNSLKGVSSRRLRLIHPELVVAAYLITPYGVQATLRAALAGRRYRSYASTSSSRTGRIRAASRLALSPRRTKSIGNVTIFGNLTAD